MLSIGVVANDINTYSCSSIPDLKIFLKFVNFFNVSKSGVKIYLFYSRKEKSQVKRILFKK
jgi:hypothetical protein